MKLKCAFACVVALSVAVSGLAADYYVDNVGGSEEYDGLSAKWDGTHGPKARIQSAVELAESGSTVWVAPGVYGDDQGVVEASSSHHACRVLVTKPITLKSIGGRDVTHIVGRLADDSVTLCGEEAVAGIVLEDVDGGFNASVIEGFTIRDCATTSTGTPTAGLGTGVAVTGKKAVPGFDAGPWVVDCVISNCAAGYGSIAYVNAARTRLSGNRINKNGLGSAAAFANLAWCIISGNRGGANIYQGTYLVNCTQVNNAGNATATASPTYIYNSIIVGNESCNTRKSVLKHCISTAGYTDEQKANGSADSGNAMNAGYSHVAAPALDDFRPVAACEVAPDAKACGFADAALLDVVPEAYRMRDYAGNAVTAVDGQINAGAMQSPMTPLAGVQVDQTISVNGNDIFAKHALFVDSWPCLLRLGSRLDATKTLFFFKVPPVSGGYRFPDADGTSLFVPYPGVAAFGLVSAEAATHELYVDCKAGTDGDGSAESPFSTIQEAVDAVPSSIANYAIIHVARGVYDRGETAVPDEAISNRVTFVGNTSYRVIATDGPEDTIIKGASDTSDPVNGIGPAAVRCIRSARSAYPLSVEGFTIEGGRTVATNSVQTLSMGGALRSNSRNTWLIGCVVSNNFAGSGSAIAGGTAYRTAFFDNPWVSAGMFHGETTVADCVVRHVAGHGANPLIGSGAVSLVNSTLVAEGASVPMILPSAHGFVFNSIVAHSKGTSANNDKKPFLGNVFWDFPYNGKRKDGQVVNAEGVDYVAHDPGFADAANGNYRLVGSAAAFGLGNAWDGLEDGDRWTVGEAYTNYYRYVMRDMDGSDPYFVDGKPTPGAWQLPAAGVVLSVGGTSVSIEGAKEGFNSAQDISSIVIRPVRGRRPAIGVSVNGVTNRFDGISGAFTFNPADLAAAGGSAEIIVVESSEWHVDAVNGNDAAGSGFFPDDAFRTLAQAMSVSIPGDTVYAHPGTYGEGSMIHSVRVASTLTDPITLRSRVVIPAGVTLCSVGGADKTIIVGERDQESANGLGDGAMRCVTMETNTCLKGFTVTGGYTRDVATEKNDFDNACGGGILSLESSDKAAAGQIVGSPVPTCLVEDCAISNNVAVSGGGAAYGSYLRCRFFENTATGGNGGAVRQPFWLYGCLSDRNVAAQEAAVSSPHRAVDCTFGAEDRRTDGIALPSVYSDPQYADYTMTNCLFVGGARCRVRYASHCAIPYEGFIYSARDPYTWNDLIVGDTSVDERYAPEHGSVAIDAIVDEAYELDVLGETDVWGGQRIYNGIRDLGAVERDWRERYAADIGGVRVASASPAVKETETGGVCLPPGAEISMWRRRSAPASMLLDVRVEGAGMLSVWCGTRKVAEVGAGEHVVELSADENADFRCSFEAGEGGSDADFAEITGCRYLSGFRFIVK